MKYSDSPENKRTGWWEIISTMGFKTLPLVAAVAFSFKYARDNIHWVSGIPSVIFNGAVVVFLLLVVQLTAGKMLRSLANEQPGGRK